MTSQPAANAAADPSVDPTLAVAERQLVLLRELAELAMVAARAFTASALSAAKAEQMILGEEWFTPEVGRARACGAKDAAESIQKVSRAARLTMRLEMTVAEIVRDIRAGKITYINGFTPSKKAGEDAGAPAEGPRSFSRSADVLVGSCRADTPDRDREPSDRDGERLVEFERDDLLVAAPFRDTVEAVCGDIGAAIDWKDWKVFPGPAKAAAASQAPETSTAVSPSAPSGVDPPPPSPGRHVTS